METADGHTYNPEDVKATYGGTAVKDCETFDPTGKYTVKKQGAFACVEAAVGPNDEVMAEGGSLISMSRNIDMNVSRLPSCLFL